MSAISKEQLLTYFRSLDISTLERLKKYSQLLIIPDEDLLVNATMQQMVDKAHRLADNLFPEWTDRSRSDFGEFLVELFALFSEKDFWYINAFANEGLLRKTRSYSNAFAKASSMGFRPNVCKSAKGAFSVEFEGTKSVKYDRGDLVIGVGDLEFTNTEPFNLATTSTSAYIQLTEGKLLSEDVTYNGYNVFIKRANIDIESISVVVDNVTYSQVRNFGNSNTDSTHFIVLPEEDGSCCIYFGNGGYGKQPKIGTTIHLEYVVCNGSKGNTDNFENVFVKESHPQKPAIGVSVTSSTISGGTYADTLATIKEKTPLYFNNKRSAFNVTTSEEILNAIQGVHKAKVHVVGRDVTYRIIPSSGQQEPTEEERNLIASEFNPCVMAGYQGMYTQNSYRDLLTMANSLATKLIVDTIILFGYDSSIIEGSIRQILDDLTNPLIDAEYGGEFSKTKTDVIMRSRIAGVQSVTFKILVNGQEQIMPDITLGDLEIFSKINQDNIEVRTNVV